MTERRDRIILGKDGHAYRMRPIRPSDAPSLVRGYAALSARAKYFRLLHTVPTLNTRFVRSMCEIDPETEACLVVEGREDLSGDLIAGARVHDLGQGRDAEYAVSARPEGEGLGLAKQALEAVIEIARARGCRSVWGLVARDNAAMLGLSKRLGFAVEAFPDDPTVVVTRILFDSNNAAQS
jgi:RimJ/RimL family protein N-acetyltransferase